MQVADNGGLNTVVVPFIKSMGSGLAFDVSKVSFKYVAGGFCFC